MRLHWEAFRIKERLQNLAFFKSFYYVLFAATWVDYSYSIASPTWDLFERIRLILLTRSKRVSP
jgi:hypothetical protein